MRSLLSRRDDMLFPVTEQFNRLFDEFFGSQSLNSVPSKSRSGYPKLDVIETESKFIIEVEVPGVNHDGIQVEILPYKEDAGTQILKISGKKEHKHQYPEGTVFHKKELRRSLFVRELVLPDSLVGDPEATFDNGLLKLVWNKPEVEKAPEPKKIPIVKK